MPTFKRLLTITLIVVLFGSIGCARKPSVKSTEHNLKRYFNKYGNKYEETDFHKYKVDYVSVMDIEEIHKHMVSVKAQVKLKDGPSYLVRCILDKKTLGWKVEAWENMQ